MKNKILAISLATCSAVCAFGLCACSTEKIITIETIKDDNPYTFTNADRPAPPLDEGMTIDGNFDEERWSNSRWLVARDKPTQTMYADIKFTTSYGANGVYFGIEVQEVDSFIFYNPNRESYMNSCIEMYAAPIGNAPEVARLQMMEFDFFANGETTNRINISTSGDAKWQSKLTVWEKTPISASTLIGGELNKGATGYTVEAYVPFSFLNFCGWNVKTADNPNGIEPNDLVIGIDPVHIFSYNYDGKDTNQDRYWSKWSRNQGYINSGWLDPTGYFRFDKNGLQAYDMAIDYNGTESLGRVTTQKGLPLLVGHDNTLRLEPLNTARTVTQFIIAGEDKTSELARSVGYYSYKIKNIEELIGDNGKLDISVRFE